MSTRVLSVIVAIMLVTSAQAFGMGGGLATGSRGGTRGGTTGTTTAGGEGSGRGKAGKCTNDKVAGEDFKDTYGNGCMAT